MRELVRRGLRALPDLIQHLQDNRPTKLSIHTNFFEGSHFSDEHDPRTRPPPTPKAGCAQSCLDEIFGTKPIYDPYVVKVGDVCYVLIGQIANRNLVAVRYQPSAMVIVNSPLEAPDLIERVTSDWSGLDARSHEASLLADIRAGDNIRLFGPALARLRFYYAGAYQSLRDEDRKKREAFEAQEKARDTAN